MLLFVLLYLPYFKNVAKKYVNNLSLIFNSVYLSNNMCILKIIFKLAPIFRLYISLFAFSHTHFTRNNNIYIINT